MSLSIAKNNECHRKKSCRLFVVFGFHHFFTTVKAIWADVVAQVNLTSYRLNCRCRTSDEVVRAVHTAF